MGKEKSQFPRAEQMRFVRSVWRSTSVGEACRLVRAEAKRFPVGVKNGWNHNLVKLADSLESGNPKFSVFALHGNRKLRFVAFSAIPVLGCPGAGACADWCYSKKAWQYPAALVRQLGNSLFLRWYPEQIASAFGKIPQGSTLRLYVDGDFSDAATVDLWFGLLNGRPDIRAYGYSKSVLLLSGRVFPSNYWLNLSSGGRHVAPPELITNPQVRGAFIAIKTDYHGVKGFARYQDPAYHRATIRAAKEQGIDKPFSCPGTCHTCTKIGPACGLKEFAGRNIVNAIH